MRTLTTSLNATIKVWPTVSKVVSTLRTEEQYNRAVRLLDKLIDQVSEEPDETVESLIDILGTLIEAYEDKYVPEPMGDPISSLKYLMEEHSLRQSDLPEVGSRKVVSEILQRKRELNIAQIKALSKRFKVSPSVFI
ncbi:transcriptional regulator [candidate division KSB1 bacterium]|nr:transcriptional regulator [candidate division KSB1 bacterium]